ncbi:hypothetical protein FB565_005773 [Actinoplanes lutulentus]|uniref:Uncharacterized protein n=1 Tax=Actinoplanes lutulentus TaxID=1287878 RepID=A0A327Z6P0_9ACTN|nr:hypothetical protein [Actinoplanes lutulentus]RAK32706.1 hypothetical protein B0I29_1131 [Actinoplanes lutulentus]
MREAASRFMGRGFLVWWVCGLVVGARLLGVWPFAARLLAARLFAARPFAARPLDARPLDARPFDARPFDARPFVARLFRGPVVAAWPFAVFG